MPVCKISGAIFDMDGTVLDSMPMWENVEYNVLLEFGYEPKSTLRQDVLPLGAMDTAPFLKKDYQMTESIEEINAGIDRQISHYYLQEATLKPGVQRFLLTLKEYGVKLALASATARQYVLPALELTGILKLFDVILTCPEVGHTKYEPQIYRRAVSAMGSDHASTWVFEDALYAIRTAKADGFPVCGVADGTARDYWEEIRETADCFLPSFTQWRSVLPFPAPPQTEAGHE